MSELHISPNFDLEDIRKIRDHNSSRHKNMSAVQLHAELSKSTEIFLLRMDKVKREIEPTE